MTFAPGKNQPLEGSPQPSKGSPAVTIIQRKSEDVLKAAANQTISSESTESRAFLFFTVGLKGSRVFMISKVFIHSL